MDATVRTDILSIFAEMKYLTITEMIPCKERNVKCRRNFYDWLNHIILIYKTNFFERLHDGRKEFF